ncbi:cytochrome c [Noviherbaspirillum agri]
MNRLHRLLAALIGPLFACITVEVAAADMAKGRQMFQQGTTPPCIVCHTLQDAGASGKVGPNLDELKPDAERVEKAVRNGLGVMPAFTDLSDEQVRLIAEYVAAATK